MKCHGLLQKNGPGLECLLRRAGSLVALSLLGSEPLVGKLVETKI